MRAFLHCEQRKADKSGCISFRGNKYDIGIRHAGKQVDVVYDPANAEILTIEVAGELPFRAHKLSIHEHVAPRSKPAAAERVAVDHSRLLDAAVKAKQKRDLTRNRAISYTIENTKE